MFEDYFKVAGANEGRRAFALDCVLKAIGTEGQKLVEGRGGIAERIVERAKILENYLKGSE